MKRGLDEQQELRLLPSVEDKLQQICESQKQPWPDADVIRQLAALSEESAKETLERISTKSIFNLGGYIKWMIRHQCTAASSPSPSKTVRSAHVQIPGASSITPRRLQFDTPGEGITGSSVMDKSEDHGKAHLVALGELEFRKQFLILSYAGGLKLKDLIVAEDIRDWKDLPMVMFESAVWEHLGRKCISTEDRRLNFDWDSGSTYVYHCYVNVDGSYRFKGPFIYKIRRTLLQKELGDDNVLMVKFAKEEEEQRVQSSASHNYLIYMKVAREGILVGLRRYRFFVFKDGGNEEKKKNPTSSPVKCYFVRVASDAAIDKGVYYKLSNRTMHEARCLFMHAHTLASIDNYMARFSLILSKTMSLKADWSLVKVETIEEEYCLDESGNRIYRDGKPLIHTDGTGFISEDLALLCPNIEAKGQRISDEHMKGCPDPDDLEDSNVGKKRPGLRTEEPPLIIQSRLFHNGSASKGTHVVNKKVVIPKELKVSSFPHYMGKNKSYPSTSILGLIYNRVDEHQTEDRSLKEVEKLPAFDETEVPGACLDLWEERYREYRKEMGSAMGDNDKESKNQSADAVIRKYREILYEANDFEETRRPIEEIYNEAHAIYHVCYDYAKKVSDVKKCSFAWRVAGKALCHLHARNTNEKFCTIVSSVLNDIL